MRSRCTGAAGKMKQFAAWFTHGVAAWSPLRKAIYESHDEVEILDAVDRFFEPQLAAQTVSAHVLDQPA